MSTDNSAGNIIYITTGETLETSTTEEGSRGILSDIGGMLGEKTEPVQRLNRHPVSIDKLKQEIRTFVTAFEQCLEEADLASAKIRLDEVEVAVEVSTEGELSIFGIGGKAGAKSSLTFKFKR